LKIENLAKRLTPSLPPLIIESMLDPARPRNPFFPLAAFSSVLFIITILALVAGVFGDQRAPLAQLLDRYAGRILAGEVAAILITGFLAMFVDRRQTNRSQKSSKPSPQDVPR
jgi:hypothetical protein